MCDEGLTADEQALVAAYWQFEEGRFVQPVQALADERSLTIPAVTALVSQKSQLVLFLGYCEGCGDELTQPAFYRQQVRTVLEEYGPRRCPGCQQAWDKHQAFELRQARGQVGNPLGPTAHPLLPWQQLPLVQQQVLECLLENEQKGAVHARLFPPDLDRHSSLWHQRWAALAQLEKRCLIKVTRGTGQRITAYQVHPEVRRQWQPVPHPTAARPEQELRLCLQPAPVDRGSGRPAFAGAMRLPGDVTLPAQSRYVYAAWLKKDGSLQLEILPLTSGNTHAPDEFHFVEPQRVDALLTRLVLGPDAEK